MLNQSMANWRRPERHVYGTMMQRCYNPRKEHYDRYGGRGIKVCQRWRDSFAAFLEDMRERPTPQHTLDRIDNDGDYEPKNCRWATRKEQARNRRSSRLIAFSGSTRTVAEWAEITGIPASTIGHRLNRLGYSIEKALTTPLMSPSAAGELGRRSRYGHDHR